MRVLLISSPFWMTVAETTATPGGRRRWQGLLHLEPEWQWGPSRQEHWLSLLSEQQINSSPSKQYWDYLSYLVQGPFNILHHLYTSISLPTKLHSPNRSSVCTHCPQEHSAQHPGRVRSTLRTHQVAAEENPGLNLTQSLLFTVLILFQ